MVWIQNGKQESGWKDYELIDTGGLEKLERFGQYILARPEPQAVWRKSLPEAEWEKQAHAHYRRTKGIDPGKSDSFEKGEWIRRKKMADHWTISYQYHEMKLTFRLGLTSFGHVGVFPEQAENWNYVFDIIKKSRVQSPESRVRSPKSAVGGQQSAVRVLNLFAYTGGASLAAKAAGADVVHVDSVKPVINWAREMMEASGLRDIRWVVEDAMKFVRREVKRGNIYQGIILDPPAYGRGPEGEKWILQEGIDELIAGCRSLLDPAGGLFIFSLYSMGFSALIAENLVKTHFGDVAGMESGELGFRDRAGRILPLGTCLRFGEK